MKLFTLIRGTGSVQAGWIRLGRLGHGLSWTRMPPLFSEREGYRTALFSIRGWRVFYLRPADMQPYQGSRLPARPPSDGGDK